MGNKRLYEIMQEKEVLYSKPDFNDEDGIKLAELEGEFAEMDGWNAEVDAEIMLNGLGIGEELHNLKMKELDGNQKVKVLLAQALFGNPDVLLLDEPTNHLDITMLEWLENYLNKYRGTIVIISHDRYFLDRVTNKTILLDNSENRLFHGNYSYTLKEQERLLLQEFEQYKTQQKKIEAIKASIKRYRDWGNQGDNEKFFKTFFSNISICS